MMEIIMESHLDGTRQGMFVHDGIRQDEILRGRQYSEP